MNRKMLPYSHGNRVHISPKILKIVTLKTLNLAVIGEVSLSIDVSN